MFPNALRRPAARIASVLAIASSLLGTRPPGAAAAPIVPSNFVVEDIAPGANLVVPICLAVMPDGRVLVGEKRGRVYAIKNGVKNPTPLWSAESEVLNSYDRGLLSIAVDPNYASNRYVYFLYTVDPDSNGVETNIEAWGRLARYQVSAADSNVVDPATRTILMGVSWPNGPLIASGSHTVGALRWGTDGSLLVSTGDGADFTVGPDVGGLQPNAFLPGRTDPAENIGAHRSQSIKSLCGKVLRINPANGQGYPSNPFWDGNPTSVRSRVWSYGFRNPYRFAVRPGSGASNPAAGDPGTIYLGDVGWNDWEELDIIPGPAFNAGWPCFEGPVVQLEYDPIQPVRLGCDSIGVSPEDPSPASGPFFSWHHRLDYVGTPSGFLGNASTGGIFYTDTLYPAQYRGKYFHADYGQNWIRYGAANGSDQLLNFNLFGSNMDGPVEFAREPVTGNILYVSIFTGQVRRIRWTGPVGGDTPPVAIATGSPVTGVPPLTVTFDGTQSSDADGDSLSWSWLFGDGSGSTLRNPQHTYTQAGSYLAILTVADGRGGEGRDSVALLVSPVTPFPSTPVLDNFNRANQPLGAPWVADVAGLAVQSNRLVQTSGYGVPIWDGDVFGPNQEAYITFATITGSPAPERDLVLKAQGATSSAAHIEVRYDATKSEVAVGTYDPFVGWLVQGTPIPATYAAGDVFGARTYSNGSVEVYKNGVKIGSRTLLGWPYIDNGGRVGLTIDAVNRGSFDDFGGGDVVFAVNHPPVASITSPADNSFYSSPDTVFATGFGADPDVPADSLDLHWDVFLHHNNHLHLAFSADDTTALSFDTEDHDDGSGVWYEVRLIVSDHGGLADTTSIDLWPDNDLEPSAVVTNADHIAPDQPAAYAFRLRNHGTLLAHTSRWRLMAGATMLAEGDTLVPPLDSVAIHLTLPPTLAPGTYTLRLVTDTLAAVHETDESNNASVRTLVIPGAATGVTPGAAAEVALSRGFPNPTRGAVSFTLQLPRAAEVGFRVVDLQGRAVYEWAPARFEAGRADLHWSGRLASGAPAPPGVYLAVVRLDGRTMIRRVALVR